MPENYRLFEKLSGTCATGVAPSAKIETYIARSRILRVAFSAAILFRFSPACLAADLIVGTVRNGTTTQPAAGDDVVLLRLDQSLHEQARTKTDAQGGFTLELQDPSHPHLVRVLHQGVSYDKQVSAGGALSINVFDAAAKAQGITGNIEILRAGTHDNALHVSDMIEIRNESSPPVTQAGARTFEVYLPANVTISSVLAAGPDNLPASISAAAVSGEPGRYAVNYPLRPGATKFAFNYDMPYQGRAKFHTKIIYPLQQLAVMVPPTMTFTAHSAAFQVLPVRSDRYHVAAAEHVKAGATLDFEISGAGALPAVQPQNRASSTPPATGAAGAAPASGVATSPNKAFNAAHAAKVSAQSSSLWWWVLGLAAVLTFGTCGLLIYRRQRPHTAARTSPGPQPAPALEPSPSLIDTLKESLFQLESDRLQGAIQGAEYVSAKRALEGSIKWAVARTATSKRNVAC
jgi:hypothetical protein